MKEQKVIGNLKYLVCYSLTSILALALDVHLWADDYTFPNQLKLEASCPGPYMLHFGTWSDTEQAFYNYTPSAYTLSVTWMYRPSTDYSFKTLDQDIGVSYMILDVITYGINWMYIVGVNPQNGNTVIEQWHFSHHPILWSYPIGGGEPDWIKPMPIVRRIELYDSSAITHIYDIFGDPQRRMLLLFGWENKCIYSFNIENRELAELFCPAENPDIEKYRRIKMIDHKTDGYIYYLSPLIKGVLPS